MKTVLITGIGGFIGYHLATSLKERGDKIIGLDNFNAYYDPSLKKARSLLLKEKGIEVIAGDVIDEGLIERMIKEQKVTHFVHLAAQAGVRYSLVNPEAYVEANILGFLKVLEICKEFPEIPLTYASSSSVYGNNIKIPFSIHDRTDNQANFYGVTKKSNELMANAYHHLYNIRTTGLRFFTVYGPWGRPDMAYYSFCKAICEGRPIDVYNYGKMQRDFTYIDDIVDGIVAAIDLEGEKEIFNLGNNRPEQLSTLIQSLEDSLNKKAIINYLPMQDGDVLSTYADIEYSKEKLKFSPKVSLSDGIAKFVDWYLNLRRI